MHPSIWEYIYTNPPFELHPAPNQSHTGERNNAITRGKKHGSSLRTGKIKQCDSLFSLKTIGGMLTAQSMAETGKTKSQVPPELACPVAVRPRAPQATRGEQSPLGQHRQPWKSNTITAREAKLTCEAVETPFCRVNTHRAHSTVAAATASRCPLKASLPEFRGRRGARPYFPSQNTGRSVRGRKRALLSSSEDKRALWLWRGPKGVPSALAWTWEQNGQRGDTPLPITGSGLTYWKQKQQKKLQDEICTRHFGCSSSSRMCWLGLEPFIAFSLCPKQKKGDLSNKCNRAPQPPNAAPWTSGKGQKERFSTELAAGVLMG